MKTIWVVDDQKHVGEVVEIIIREIGGYGVNVFSSAAEVREALKQKIPDLLITDWTMPGEDGIELAKFVNSAFPEIRIVLMTGKAELLDKEKLQKIGISTVLKKPFTEKELSCVI